jgi:formate dehydrogenase iron-sulfur subunit
MTIAGIAVGATKGYVYIRSEYPDAIATMKEAIGILVAAKWLGKYIQGTDKSFDLEIRRGAGAYICGEETAMLESLEGKRGMVRPKPPIPALEGLFGKPTVINNVLSFAAVPYILARGSKAYADFGMGRSRGTLPFQLAGNIKRGGLVEKAFGVSLRTLINDFGGGTSTGKKFRAAQIGGPLGAYVSAEQLDLVMDYETLAANNAMVGHGGVVVFDSTVDMAAQARFAMEFCAIESCGKCTPCRIGSTRGMEVIDKITANDNRAENMQLLEDLCQTMTDGSLCAMGGLTPMPVMSAVKLFPEDFGMRKPSKKAAE